MTSQRGRVNSLVRFNLIQSSSQSWAPPDSFPISLSGSLGSHHHSAASVSNLRSWRTLLVASMVLITL